MSHKFLKPKHSYGLICTSEFIATTVTNYLIHINSIAGVNVGQNIFGNCLVVSDTEEPLKHKIVISKVQRQFPFESLDIDHHWIELFCEIMEIKNPEFKRLLTAMTGSLDEKYMLALRIQSQTNQNNFDVALASSIINNEYKLRFSTRDKINSIIALVTDLSKASWVQFVHHVKEEDYGLIISTLEKANNGEIKQIQQSPQNIKNLLNISISALKSQNFSDFNLNLLKTVISK